MRNFKSFKILILFLAISCQPQAEKQVSPIDFFENELLSNSKEPVLNIYYQSDECGEWGGHEELIEITRKKNREAFELTYTEYRVDCDSMINELYRGAYIARPFRELVQSTKMEMTEPRKEAILNFSVEMVKSKFEEPFPFNAGVVLSITNSDSTFNLSTWGGTDVHYLKLISTLKSEH